MIDWEKQHAIFRANVEWQERLRDLILKPRYYERYHGGKYEFIAHTDERAAGGVDTIASGKTFDEKIVQWPRDKTTGKPRAEGYTAFALETMSCTVPGHERPGWMKTNAVNFLLYCFASLNEQALDCYLIDLQRLQAWFSKEDHEQWPCSVSEQANHTECRIVPIAQVCRSVQHRRWQFSRPPYFDGHMFMHYCHCSAWGAHGFGYFPRKGQFGEWYCAQHIPPEPPAPQAPAPQPVPPPRPSPPEQGRLF